MSMATSELRSGKMNRRHAPSASRGRSSCATPTSATQPNSTSPRTTRTRASKRSVVPPTRHQASDRITRQTAQPVDPSPWFLASLPVVDDVWSEMPGPNSLTSSNLGQHNKSQQQAEEGADDIAVSPTGDDAAPPPNTQPAQGESASASMSGSATTIASQSVLPEIISPPTPDTQGPTAPKARRKLAARDVQVPTSKIASPPAPTASKDHPTTPTLPTGQPKPVENDSKKQKGPGPTISLGKEGRKAKARKATEKERERVAHANTAGGHFFVEKSQPFTSSWGLPTLQAGARYQTPLKEALSSNPTPATPAAPVWTNATPPPTAKKTMREIQEEEERKKLAVKESMASAAARQAYAMTPLKVVPSAQATGGSWTTVGPNSKPTPLAASTSSNRFTPTTTLRANGMATRQAAATTMKVATPRVEDFPVAPSHDFTKWLGESLKGLNSSANSEEITSTLLSFPLDPDESTLKIISDLISANSTTLDGRRFASEYVNKRKADVAARGGAVGSSSKPVSVADVARTHPRKFVGRTKKIPERHG